MFVIRFFNLKIEVAIEIINTQKTRTILNAILGLLKSDSIYFPGVVLNKCTSSFRAKINVLIYDGINEDIKFHKLRKFIETLETDEMFGTIINNSLKREEFQIGFNYIFSHSNGIDFETLNDDIKERTKNLFKNYTTRTLDGSSKVSIGEFDKLKRNCRFCNTSESPELFQEDAHAISESIGNKKIYCNEECDVCNGFFGKTIEQEFANYFEVFRTFFQIKGKTKVPKSKGQNYKFETIAEDLVLTYKLSEKENNSIDEITPTIQLKATNRILKQNLYKTLCKFYISCIPNEHLPAFEKTIEWIGSDHMHESLPKLAFTLSMKLNCDHPKLTYYLRQNDNFELPKAICELRFGIIAITYIVPTFKNIENDFTNELEYCRYWNLMKEKYGKSSWMFADFSSSNAEKNLFNFKLLE